MSTLHFFRRWRAVLTGFAAALVLTFAVGTPEGRTVLADFLTQFRSRRIAVVSFDADQPSQPLSELSPLGDLQVKSSNRSEPTGVKSIAEASQKVGFALKQPDRATLPDGLSEKPNILVAPAREVRFTFDQAKARRHFKERDKREKDKPAVNLPDQFDGATLVLSLPAAALLEYRRAGQPGLMIAQTSEITAGIDGKVSLDEMREFLLDLPGMSRDTVRQLRNIKDWRHTLPLLVPADKLDWEPTTIGGGDGWLFRDNSGLGSAAVWVRDGRISSVVGTAKPAEIERVANSLAR